MAKDSKRRNRSSAAIAPYRKYKGVIPRLCGRWGCQIYANQKRVWIGTFDSEKDAAMAYQSAALKLQIPKALRNIPTSEAIAEELKFQSFYSTEAVLNMIKDGSYPTSLAYYLKTRSLSPRSSEGMISHRMFQKKLTPSDVGKLKILVIPKKAATKFFPPVPVETEENAASKGVQLFFYDRSMKLWKFWFCYRRCHKSYVFSTGWSIFVREKMLKVKDTIAFLKCESNEGPEGTSTFYLIDVNPGDSGSSDSGSSTLTNLIKQPRPCPTIVPDNDDVEKRNSETERKAVILFGVDISSTGK